jgi:hypothetical protein
MPPTIVERLRILESDARRFGYSDQADRLAQRVRDAAEPLLVMVVGEGNVGKSTLVNALVGKAVAPVSRLPKTWKVDLFQTGRPPRAELHWRSRPDRPDPMSIERAREVADAEEARLNSVGSSRSDLYQVRWIVDAPWPSTGVALVDTPGIAQLRADVSVRATKLHGAEGFEVQAEDPFLFWYTRADSVLWCVNATKLADEDARAALEATAHLRRRILGVVTRMDLVPRERWPEILVEANRQFGQWIPDFVPVSAAGRDSAATADTIPALRARLEAEVTGAAAKLKESANKGFYERERAAFLTATRAVAEAWRANDEGLTSANAGIAAAGLAAEQVVEAALCISFCEARKAAIGRLQALWAQSGADPARFGDLVSAQAIDEAALGSAVQAQLAAAAASLEQGIRRNLHDLSWRAVRVGTSGTEVAARPAQVSWVQISRAQVQGKVKVDIRGNEAEGLAVGVGGAAALVGMAVLGPIGIAAGVIGWFARDHFQEGEAKAKGAIEDHLHRAEIGVRNAAKSQLTRAVREAQAAIASSFERWHGGPATALLGVLQKVDAAWERQEVDDGLDLRPVSHWADGIGLSGLGSAWHVVQHLKQHPRDTPALVSEVEARWREAFDRAFVASVQRTLPPVARADLRAQLTHRLFGAILREASEPATPVFARARMEGLIGLPGPLRSRLPKAAVLLEEVPDSVRLPLERLAGLAGHRRASVATEFDGRVKDWKPAASALPVPALDLAAGSPLAFGLGMLLAAFSGAIATVAWGTVYAWTAVAPVALGGLLVWATGADVLRMALRLRHPLAWQAADSTVEGWLRVAFADPVLRKGPFGTAEPAVLDLSPLDEPLPLPPHAVPANAARRLLLPGALALITALLALGAAKAGVGFRPEFLGHLCDSGDAKACVAVCQVGSDAAVCADAATSLARYSGMEDTVLSLLDTACNRGDAAVCLHLAWARRPGGASIPAADQLPWLATTSFSPDANASAAAAKAACSLGERRACVLGLEDLDIATWPELTEEQRAFVAAECAAGVVAACAIQALASMAGHLDFRGTEVRSRLQTACLGDAKNPAIPRFCRDAALAHLDRDLGRIDALAALTLFDAAYPRGHRISRRGRHRVTERLPGESPFSGEAPAERGEEMEAVDGPGGDLGEDIDEVGPGVDALEHAAPDEGEAGGGGHCSAFRACEEPIFAPDNCLTKLKLTHVVVHGQLPVIEEDPKGGPAVERVGDGVAEAALRAEVRTHALHPGEQAVDQRPGVALADGEHIGGGGALDAGLDGEQVADGEEGHAGFVRMMDAGVEEVAAKVAPAARALQAVVADELVEFAAPICEEQLPLELLEEFGGMLAVLGAGEDEAHLLLVGDRPEAPLSQRAVGAVLHGHPGVIDLEPRAAEQTAVDRVGDGAEDARSTADPRGQGGGGEGLPLPLHAGGLAIQRQVVAELVDEDPGQQPIAAKRLGQREGVGRDQDTLTGAARAGAALAGGRDALEVAGHPLKAPGGRIGEDLDALATAGAGRGGVNRHLVSAGGEVIPLGEPAAPRFALPRPTFGPRTVRRDRLGRRLRGLGGIGPIDERRRLRLGPAGRRRRRAREQRLGAPPIVLEALVPPTDQLQPNELQPLGE